MALIACRECNQQISDKAVTCPHCGAPQQPVTASVSPPAASPPPAAVASPPPAPEPPTPRAFASTPPAASSAAPPPQARGTGGRILVILAILIIVGVAVALVIKRGTAHASVSPAPSWLVDNVDANDSCTVLGEFCIRVRCAVTNAGTAEGIVQVTAQLNEDSVPLSTRRGTRSLVPGQQDTLTFDFPEANLGKEHTFRCSPVP